MILCLIFFNKEVYMTDKRRQGVTLIEALFVLGIMVIIIGMAVMFYSYTTEKELELDNINEVNEILNAANTIYKDKPDFTGLTADILISSGLIDKKYIKDGNLFLKGGGTIFPYPFYQDGQARVALFFYNVPKLQCVAMWDSSVYDRTLYYEEHATWVTPSEINSICNSPIVGEYSFHFLKN